MSTPFSSFLDWWSQHALATFLITCGSIAAAFHSVGKFIKWFLELTKPNITPLELAQKDLEEVKNDRYGFSFQYPLRWYRQTSTNSDGHTIRNPDDPRIEVRGWGGHDSLDMGLDGWIHFTLGDKKPLMDSEVSVGDFRLVGRRLTWNEGRMRVMQVFVQRRTTQVAVRCTCPARLYPKYESAFLRLCQSLSLLGDAYGYPSVDDQVLETIANQELWTGSHPRTGGGAACVRAAEIAQVLSLPSTVVTDSLERLEMQGRVKNGGGTLSNPHPYWFYVYR